MSVKINGRTITARHVGLLVVIFALGVTIPRLVFAFALSDNLVKRLGEDAEFVLLMTSAVMGAVVLTTGNAFLSHILADNFHRRNALWAITAVAWGVNLVFAVFIIAPTLMVGMQDSPLASILRVQALGLPPGLMQWAWCVTAALAFELLAAGSMAAYAIAGQPQTAQGVQVAPASDVLAEIAARLQVLPDLAARVADLERVQAPQVAPLAPASSEVAPASIEVAGASDVQLTDEQRKLLAYLERNPLATYTDISKHLGKSRPTATNWVQELMDAGIVTRNGHGFEVHA